MRGEGAGLNRAFNPKSWPKERLIALLGPLSVTAEAHREHLQQVVDTLQIP